MPPKKKPALHVGDRISCPSHIFGERGAAYLGVVTALRTDKADIRFDEDGSKYWFPAKDAAAWVVPGGKPLTLKAASAKPATVIAASPPPARGGATARPMPRKSGAASGTAAASPARAPSRLAVGAQPMKRAPGRPPKAVAGAPASVTRPLRRAARQGSYVSDSAALGLMGTSLAAVAMAASWWLLRVAAPGPDGVPLA